MHCFERVSDGWRINVAKNPTTLVTNLMEYKIEITSNKN